MSAAAPSMVLTGGRSGQGLHLFRRRLLRSGILEVPRIAALDAAQEEAVEVVSQQKVAFALGAGLE